MRSRRGPRGWTITARLVMLALVPATLMLIAVNVSLYVTATREVAEDIGERGRLIAAALAEASRYGVISGNTQSVEQAVRGLMAADPSVAGIEVLDASDRQVVSMMTEEPADGRQVFEVPIGGAALDVDLFDTMPGVGSAADTTGSTAGSSVGSMPGAATPNESRTPPVGRVRVVMSPAPILEAKRERLYFGSAMVLLAALLSAVVGLGLAKRLREPLNAVMSALRGIRQGRYDVRLDHPPAGEIGELQATIVEMARALQVTHRDLESKVAARTEELEQAVAVAREADAEKRRLITRGNELVEEERRRISLEIHDDLNALLVAIRLQVGTLAGTASDANQPQLAASVDRIAGLVDDVYERSRTIVQRLRPEIIDTLGLAGAIEELVRHFDEADRSCRYAFACDQNLPTLPENVAIAAYRVVQEALSNVARHSGASRCAVTIARVRGTGIEVAVRDNGRGFDAGAKYAGLGMLGMRERIAVLNGTLSIESARWEGTHVKMVLPVP